MIKSNVIQIRIDNQMKEWFDILENKYRIKRCHFVRDAIVEKFKRDTPNMRKKLIKEKLPF